LAPVTSTRPGNSYPLNAAVMTTYLAGGDQRRIRAVLQPLLKAAPLSKSTVSRIVATLTEDLQAWEKRPLTDLEVVYLYLDALFLRVRRDHRVEGVPVLAAVAVLADGQKQLTASTSAAASRSRPGRATWTI
jgi:putative transposase